LGTATYHLPMLADRARQQTLAIRIIQAALGKAGKPMHVRLAETIVAAHRGAWKSD
jgi:ribosomal protein S7